jgi:hypothetical protein
MVPFSSSGECPMVATIIPLNSRRKPATSIAGSPRSREPVFDPNRHLALAPPSRIVRLGNLGSRSGEDVEFSTDLAITTPFRLLSAEGTAAALEAAACVELDKSRHGCSTFLSDLLRCRDVTEFISWLAGTSLISVPSLLTRCEAGVLGAGTWHLGQPGFECLLGLGTPEPTATGYVEWFRGHSAVGMALIKAHGDIPGEHTDSQPLPPAGFAVLTQPGQILHCIRGNVDHIVTAHFCPDETAAIGRSGFASSDSDPDRAMIEWMRHKARLSHRKLGRLLTALDPADPAWDRQTLAHYLYAALTDAQEAVEALCSESEGLDIYYES